MWCLSWVLSTFTIVYGVRYAVSVLITSAQYAKRCVLRNVKGSSIKRHQVEFPRKIAPFPRFVPGVKWPSWCFWERVQKSDAPLFHNGVMDSHPSAEGPGFGSGRAITSATQVAEPPPDQHSCMFWETHSCILHDSYDTDSEVRGGGPRPENHKCNGGGWQPTLNNIICNARSGNIPDKWELCAVVQIAKKKKKIF